MVGLALLTAHPPEGLGAGAQGIGISNYEESLLHPLEWQERAREQGEALRHQLEGVEHSAVIMEHRQCLPIMHRSYALEGMAGLTDRDLPKERERFTGSLSAEKQMYLIFKNED